MKINKLLTICLAAMTLGLVACNNNTPTPTPTPTPSTPAESTPAESTPAESTPAAHQHVWLETWEKNEAEHWHKCEDASCVEVDSKASHTFEEEVTKAPTYSETGEKTLTCDCGYSKTEEVAKLETKLVLNASDLEAGVIDPGEYLEHEGFTLITDNPTQAVEKVDKSLEILELESELVIGEESFTQRIKTGGGSTTKAGSEERLIQFTTTGQGTVKVYAKHGSTTEGAGSLKLSLFNVENGVQHDVAVVEQFIDAAVYELEMHYAGTFYVSATANVSIYKVEVNWEDGVNDLEWEPAFELADPNVLNASELSAQTIEEDTTIGCFTINAGAAADSQEVVIDGNNKKYDGVNYTARIKLGGGPGSTDYRSITINVEGPATITVLALSSSGSNPTTANLFDANGNKMAENDLDIKGKYEGANTIGGFFFEVTEAGSYTFMGTAKQGLNVYAIIIQPAA